MTVVAGYIRMLLKERAGPVSEDQRKLLQEAEKSCGRLSGLIAELSDLANLEAGTIQVAKAPLDIHAVLTDAISMLPEMTDRGVRVELLGEAGPVPAMGDPTRLRNAVAAIIGCLRRELVTSDALLIKYWVRTAGSESTCVIAIADAEGLAKLEAAAATDLGLFDEWRGGCGLSLAIARRTVSAHGGSLWSPADGSKVAAVLHLPLPG
jgi:two-component system sensor histidine kinase BarA